MPDTTRRSAPNETTDEGLMERYVDGDADAFEELFRRYEARVFTYFARRTRCPDRSQDLYQELFLRIHRARDLYDPDRPFAPWLFQIAHHLVIDDAKRAYREHELPLPNGDTDVHAGAESDPVALREQLAQVLDGLSSNERYVLLRAKGEGVPYSELAVQLGKSVDAVKQMASRAVRRMRAATASGSVLLHRS